jgi:hypothetical protein
MVKEPLVSFFYICSTLKHTNMKRKIYALFIITGIILFLSAFTQDKKKWKSLFNGEDLSGWETYAGPKEKDGKPLGLNNDPMKLFSVVELDGEKVLRISGEINASIATKEEFENYHLVMEFKWGEKLYTRYNSGLLYHSYGDYGAGIGVWMSSHEFQLFTGNVGDSYRMGNTYCEIPILINSEGRYVYNRKGENRESKPKSKSVIVAKDNDYEKPKGEWNKVELYCYGRTSVHVVNGNVNMINFKSGKYLDGGIVEPLSKGKIQIQSEGGELFVRNIRISPIDQIPAELLK